MQSIIITAILGYFAIIFKEIPTQLFKILINKSTNSFTVMSKNKILYDIVNNWLFSFNSEQLKNHINGNQIRDDSYDEQIKYSIDYGNYIIKIKRLNFLYITKELIQNSFDTYDKINICFIGFDRNYYKDQLLAKIKSDHDRSNKLRVYPCNNLWDNYLTDRKDFSNIICNKKDIVLDFINKWLSHKSIYKDKGIIYKTGILLYGKSGTGKTSICRAVASKLNFNLHIINLKAYENTQDLINRMVNIPSKSVILFEDIDCVLGNKINEKDNERKELLETVLNIIDGAMSPTECIFFATTNKFELLDEALIREGRFDLKLEIDYFDIVEAKQMCDLFNCTYDVLDKEIFPIKPSYLQQKILNNLKQIKL